MVRERTPARSQQKNRLGESWVVEGEDGDDEETPSPVAARVKQRRESVEPEHIRQRKVVKTDTRFSAEPHFIMPSMASVHDANGMGSWLGDDKRSGQPQMRTPRLSKQEGSGSRRPRQPHRQDSIKRAETALVVTATFLSPIIKWVYEVLGTTLQALKAPISYLLVVWVLIGAFVVLRNLFFSSVYTALSPICRIPGAGLLHLPMCQSGLPHDYAEGEPPPVKFDQLMLVQNKFEEVLQESAGGVSLPLDMKRGETSIRDLRQVVRFSQLHSKNELVLEFDGFIETARIASYDLQKFNSHVGRGVDNILATARWTKRVLDGIAETDASKGALANFFGNTILMPFQPLKFTEDTLVDQYIQHTRVVEDEVNRLVKEAQAVLMLLQNLEDRLDVIHGIAVRDDIHAQGSKNEVLSQLWTMLGGNRSKLGRYDSQLRLLGQVNTYRQNAIAHVSGTLVKLQGMGAELEELRERVGSVELLGGKGAVPLRMHIENIEMGVERLEKGRKGAKELENEELSKSLGRGAGESRMIDEK